MPVLSQLEHYQKIRPVLSPIAHCDPSWIEHLILVYLFYAMCNRSPLVVLFYTRCNKTPGGLISIHGQPERSYMWTISACRDHTGDLMRMRTGWPGHGQETLCAHDDGLACKPKQTGDSKKSRSGIDIVQIW